MASDWDLLGRQLWQLGLEIIEVRCCRSWPAIRGLRIGRCRYCGERPEIVGDWEEGAA